MARFKKFTGVGRIKQKPILSPMDTLRRKYTRFKIWTLSVIGVLVIGLGMLVYTHYDYIVFRMLIAGNYIHTNVLDEMFEEHIGFVPDRYGSHFDNLVISIVTREIRRASDDRYTFMYTPRQREAHEARIAERAARVDFREIAPNVGILTMHNISPYVQNFVHNNRHEINSFDNLIIDLRGNNGGELSSMQAIAGMFLPRRATVGFDNARLGIFSRERRASGAQFFEFEQIVILQDESTASAAESLIAALSANLDNVTTIGLDTFGKAVGQVLVPLRRGFAVNATVITIKTPGGGSINNVGIAPDIVFEDGDIVQFALSILE
ncbi:MAG: S41 family peptidase [Defluviitaleaceae bacterium]|nr:S41 family peptidase [Defluviitaleaceae bacterium]